jgi:hypothetical protein
VTPVERLEALTEPRREVDEIIFREHSGQLLQKFSQSPPAYTSSLDAALLLVPEGWRLAGLADTIEFDKGCRAVVRKRGDTSVARGSQVEHRGAKTLPIALCIAALKARGVK